MEYVYATLLLNETNSELNQSNIAAVLAAAGVEVSESRVRAIVAALEDVDLGGTGPRAVGDGTDGDPVESTDLPADKDDAPPALEGDSDAAADAGTGEETPDPFEFPMPADSGAETDAGAATDDRSASEAADTADDEGDGGTGPDDPAAADPQESAVADGDERG